VKLARQRAPRRLCVAMAAGLAAMPVLAQSVRVEPVVTVGTVATDNAQFVANNEARKDLYLELMPRLNVAVRGGRNRLSLSGGFDAVSYVRNSEPERIHPVASAEWVSTLIDQNLFLDASARLDRRAASPYAAQAVGVAAGGQVNSSVYRLSPHLRLSTPASWVATARSDNVLTRRSDGQATDTGELSGSAYSQDTQAHLERLPEPFGFGLDAQHQRLRYLDTSSGNLLGLDAVRASLGYALSPELTAHLLGGSERSVFSGRKRSDSDVGLRLRWVPMPRSQWSLEVRRRFFGNGFNASWVHNAPFWSMAVSASREPMTQPGALRLAPVDGDLAGYFDDTLRSAGYLDAAQRAQLVRDSLDALGLSPSLTEPVNVYTSYPQLGTGGDALLTLRGRRTTVGLTVYARQLQRLSRTGDVLDLIGSLQGDLRQYGAQAGADFRLTPSTTLNATLRAYRAISLSGISAVSTDGWATLGLGYSLSPRSRLGLSLQHHRLESTIRPAARATSVGASLTHRF
jgi:uncharacterized protein (PEP-CTERM system associated)